MDDLRKLAEAAAPGPWMVDYQSSYPAGEMVMTENGTEIAFAQKHGTAAYIAAAAPDVVLGLLAERDEAREAVRRLAGALVDVLDDGDFTDTVVAMEALADPVVRRIVGE